MARDEDSDDQPRRRRASRQHRIIRRFNFTGLFLAVVFFCWSMTPSLVPRSWVLQGIVSGLVSAIGYGLGVLGSHLARRVVPREPRRHVKRIAWRVLGVVGALAAITLLVAGASWQRQIHVLLSVEQEPALSYVGTALLTLVVMLALVQTARGLRWVTARIARLLHQVLPPRIANPIAVALVAVLVVGVLDGIAFRGFLDAADGVSRAVDTTLVEEVPRPTSRHRSGAPGSLLRWEDLGSKGRRFVSSGPSVEDLESFSGRPASEPIRVYAGLEASEDERERARLVLDELERLGSFERSVLCVVVPTGTGWVNLLAAEALEYLHGGDTALVSMQYSYLPSWLSYLVDVERAREAGRVLFDEVYDRWSELPEEGRPKLVVYGESMGSHGSEAAFSGIADLRSRIDGALWVGPPNFNTLWREFIAQRDPGTPERLPTFEQGRTVRFASTPEDLERPGGEWEHPRVVYLQNASDPVVWWSPRLILRRPDWLREPRGPDVLPAVRWFPIVTFAQLSVDLLYDYTIVPEPHGHSYGSTIGDAWAAIVPPDEWSDDEMARLRAILAEHPSR